MTVSDLAAYHKLITDSYDKRSRTYWGNSANAYQLVEHAPPRLGDRVLDIGTGTGIAAFYAANFVGSEGGVTGVDISNGMITRANELLKERMATNINFHIADAEQLPFANSRFDRIYCASAFFWIVNKVKALRHWNDLLAPGGIVGFHAWPEDSYIHSYVAQQVLKKYGISYLAHTPTGSKEICTDIMRNAGYEQIRIVEKEEGGYISLQDAKDSWIDEDHYPIGQYPHPVTGVPPEVLEQARRDYDLEMERRNTDKGIWNNTTLYFVYGTKPISA
jgi:ubiquinone/menaquinone biosynthesis C-methylase UbiE